MLVKLILIAGTFGVQVPSSKHMGTDFVKVGGHSRSVIIPAQAFFILNCEFFFFRSAIVKNKTIAITDIIELCSFTGTSYARAIITGKSKALKFIVIFFRNTIAANTCNRKASSLGITAIYFFKVI